MKRDVNQIVLKSMLYAYNRHLSTQLHQFVPKHKPVSESDVKRLQEFIFNSKKLLVLTGAGISTESGIPDYRSKEVGLYERTNHKPIQHIEFIKSATVRQRYWARNFVGWFRFSKSLPNSVHFSIRDLEIEDKIVHTVVTQNVDGLHLKAGSRNCDALYDRDYIQGKLLENNSIDFEETTKMIRPDGDVEIASDFMNDFIPPICETCGGVLKPDITFFGDNVPKQRVDLVREKVSLSDRILVLGSSLSVFSALEEKKPVCIVNIGSTRADKLINLKIDAKCGDILPRIKS
ncbi:hypothetical protein D910_09874 [Dendroctonus ponderosae]|uniref:Deacetylase sirtuin-type domain-containing protein n=1 Tax=Dendroctonus ponderosae TaxID=77166 RepID=U4UQX7_DENPD|nr:hypothetical protein D910_09874 [Dendroctonus ponderosae]